MGGKGLGVRGSGWERAGGEGKWVGKGWELGEVGEKGLGVRGSGSVVKQNE